MDDPDGFGGLPVVILADWGNNNEEGRWLYALAATKIVISVANADISICLLQCVDHVSLHGSRGTEAEPFVIDRVCGGGQNSCGLVKYSWVN